MDFSIPYTRYGTTNFIKQPTYRNVRGRRRTGYGGKPRFRFLIGKAPLLLILYLMFILSMLSTALFFLTVDKQLQGRTLSLTSDDKEPKRNGKTRQAWRANIFDAADLFAIKPLTSTVASSTPKKKVDGVEEHLRGGKSDKIYSEIEGFVEHNSVASEICPEFEIPHLVGPVKDVDMKDISLKKVEQKMLGSHFGNVSELLVQTNKIISKLDRTNMTKQEDSSTYCVEIKGTMKCQQLFPGATVSRGLSISNYTYMPGGHWKPKDCLPRWKVAVIIPYRDRPFHLPIVLEYLTPLMQRQRLEFGFFVIDQANELNFNRAMLMNVGFLESLNVTKWDCFIFHDVDHIPLDDNNYYGCSGMPKHFMSGSDRWNYKLPYNTFFGAVTGFSRGQMYEINGFPNVYWGWGGEDDEIFKRIDTAGYAILRNSKTVGRYNVIKHHHHSAPKANDRFDLLKDFRPRQEKDGLTNLKYSKPIITMNALYTNISVDIQKLPVTWPESAKKGKNKAKPKAQPAQKGKPNVQPVNTKGKPNVQRVNTKEKPNAQPVQGKPNVQPVNTKEKPNVQPANTKEKPNVQPVQGKPNVQPVNAKKKPNAQPDNKKTETKPNIQPANTNTKEISAVNQVTIPLKPVNTKVFPLGNPVVQPNNKKPETKPNVQAANTKTKETAAVDSGNVSTSKSNHQSHSVEQKVPNSQNTAVKTDKVTPQVVTQTSRKDATRNSAADAIAKAKAQMKAIAEARRNKHR